MGMDIVPLNLIQTECALCSSKWWAPYGSFAVVAMFELHTAMSHPEHHEEIHGVPAPVTVQYYEEYFKEYGKTINDVIEYILTFSLWADRQTKVTTPAAYRDKAWLN